MQEQAVTNYEDLDPDVRLMLQVRDDNAAAFEELVTRYQARLLSLFRHLIRGKDQSEDLAQEVFLRIYRARKRYVPGAKFSTWLFKIAHNVASNALRSASRRREVNIVSRSSGALPSYSLDGLAQAASGLMPTRQLDTAERAEMVRLAMDSLNDRQRMALLLSKFEGMTYADIAETMDLSTAAIKSLLSRARGNLREILEPYIDKGLLTQDVTSSSPVDNAPNEE